MDVLLVNPPFHRFFGSEQDYIPLGLSYLASLIDDCFVYNAEIDNKSSYVGYDERTEGQNTYINRVDGDGEIWLDVEDRIRGYNPKIVGIYAPTVKLKSALHVARIVKKLNSKAKVVLGGPHPTIRPHDVLKSEHVDSVVVGEGEIVFPELVKDLLNNGFSKTIYKSEKFIKDINLIEPPAREKMLDKYSSNGYGHIISARGCPFLCSYCGSNVIWGRNVRFRSIDNIISEIIYVRDTYGTTDFTFWDETFTINKKRVLALCDKIKDLGVTWRCDTRIDVVDEELLLKMMDSGLTHISIGIESGNQETLDFIDKGLKLERMKEKAKMLNKIGIFWKAYLMVGFPNETEKHVLDTINIIDELKPKRATLSIFTPYPGTKLFDYCVEEGIIKGDIEWEKYSHQSKFNYFSPKISEKRFHELVKMASTKIDDYNNRKGDYEKWIT
jgi:radical SAM superfamily enzyme YgiQ (UPF0313 family)